MDSKLYSKCKIINEMYDAARNDPSWAEFFSIYDVGVPLARVVFLDCAEPTEDGIDFLEETWYGLCHMMGIDYMGDYYSLDDMIQIGELPDES